MNDDAFRELDQMANNLPKTINGYTFEELIGKGGFSRVFLVTSPKYDIKFCAKVMPKSLQTDNQNDIDYLLHLDHPNIIRIYDQFIIGPMVYCILEYCPGGDLHSAVKSGKLKKREKILFFMQEILLALDFCHVHHIAHRDIKPANILIDRYGRPKLIDFGISLRLEPGELIRDYSGSKAYSAPEIILEQPHDPYKADCWSLGVTFYFMIIGKMPWPKKPEKIMTTAIEQAQYLIPRSTHPAFCKIINSMLQVDPEERPNIAELLKCGLFPEKVIIQPVRAVNIVNKQKKLGKSKEEKEQTNAAQKALLFCEIPQKKKNTNNFFVIRSLGNRNCSSVNKTVSTITTTMTSMDMFQCEEPQVL